MQALTHRHRKAYSHKLLIYHYQKISILGIKFLREIITQMQVINLLQSVNFFHIYIDMINFSTTPTLKGIRELVILESNLSDHVLGM